MDYVYLEKQLPASKLFEVILALIYGLLQLQEENNLNLFILFLGRTEFLKKRDKEETECYDDFQGIKTVSVFLLLLSLLCYYYYYYIILYYIIFFLFHFISKLRGKKNLEKKRKKNLDNMYNTCKQQ